MTGRTAAAHPDESLPREARLRRRADYQRCYRQGRRRHGDLVILYAAENETGQPRIGITVTKKVGNSVVRHRVKRRIREIYRRWSERSQLPAMDFMVHVKPPAGRATFRELRAELTRLLATWLPRDPAAS